MFSLRLLTAPPNPPSPPAAADLQSNLCTATALFGIGTAEPVPLEMWQQGSSAPNSSWSEGWRYFTAFECGRRHMNVCLAFRERAQSARWVGGLQSFDGFALTRPHQSKALGTTFC